MLVDINHLIIHGISPQILQNLPISGFSILISGNNQHHS